MDPLGPKYWTEQKPAQFTFAYNMHPLYENLGLSKKGANYTRVFAVFV